MKFKKQVKLIVFFFGSKGNPSNKLYVREFTDTSSDFENREGTMASSSVRLTGSAKRDEAVKYEVADAVNIQKYLEDRFKYVTGVEVA